MFDQYFQQNKEQKQKKQTEKQLERQPSKSIPRQLLIKQIWAFFQQLESQLQHAQSQWDIKKVQLEQKIPKKLNSIQIEEQPIITSKFTQEEENLYSLKKLLPFDSRVLGNFVKYIPKKFVKDQIIPQKVQKSMEIEKDGKKQNGTVEWELKLTFEDIQKKLKDFKEQVSLEQDYFALFEFDSNFLLVDDKFIKQLKAFKKNQNYFLTGNIVQVYILKFEGYFLPILIPRFTKEVAGLNIHHYLNITKEIQLKYYKTVFPFDFFEHYYI